MATEMSRTEMSRTEMSRTEMSLETIRDTMNNSPVQEWEADMDHYESFLIEQYNRVSSPYRDAMLKLDAIRKARHEERVRICDHDFERFCEFHNDVYFVCRKCGHEK
jgi:hypothetical protein